MKRITLLFVLAVLALPLVSQSDKKVRFGIRTTPAFNWMGPENDKKIQKGGAVMKAGIGLVLEFNLTEVASFQTGVEYTGAGCKAKYGTDTAFYQYKDDEIIEATITNDSISGASTFLVQGGAYNRLMERKYGIGYLNIPLTFKLKTKDIGGFTYFGQIGGNMFIKVNSKSNDKVETTKLSGTTIVKTTQDIEKVNTSSGMNLFTAAASVGGGAEYNISGSTSLFFSLHYQHNFMFAAKQESGYLIRSKTESSITKNTEFPNGMRLRQFVIAIGVLF